jgi:hypothetical protein
MNNSDNSYELNVDSVDKKNFTDLENFSFEKNSDKVMEVESCFSHRKYLYRLHGIVVHRLFLFLLIFNFYISGNSEGGHYYSLISDHEVIIVIIDIYNFFAIVVCEE